MFINQKKDKKKLNQLNSEKELKIWLNSKKNMDNLKQKLINKSLNRIAQKKLLFNTHMKLSDLFLQNEAKNFEDKLSLFQDPKKAKRK